MKHLARLTLLMISSVAIMIGCGKSQSSPTTSSDQDVLVGAWRSKIVFQSGPLAGVKDLEFLYSYNAGGTMTESSNYDEAANSSPPAYGIWRKIGPKTFQTKYLFYTTRKGGTADGEHNSDWWPDGHGVLTETIKLSTDGQAYSSTIKLATYDKTDRVIPGEGDGTGVGTRIMF